MIDSKLIIKLIKEKRIKKISNRMFQVDNHNVFFQPKRGRTLLLCDCTNDTKFCSDNFCFHKQVAIGSEVLNYFLEKLDNKIKMISSLKYSKDKEKSFQIAIDELKELRSLRI